EKSRTDDLPHPLPPGGAVTAADGVSVLFPPAPKNQFRNPPQSHTHMFTHLNIFSGAGGFELAATAVGWENIASCEINRYAQQLLQLRFGHHVHHDATSSDWRYYRYAIDVLTMSPPCQGHSTMGKRLSRSDDRDMLAVCVRALDEIRPRVAVLENVPGLLSSESGRAIRDLCQAMASAGDAAYTLLPLLIPAGGAGALHLRTRLWLVAHANAKRRQSGRVSTLTSPPEIGHTWHPEIDAHAEPRRAAGQTGILRIYDALPPALDARAGQKLRLMGTAVPPPVVIPLFQSIDAALRAE